MHGTLVIELNALLAPMLVGIVVPFWIKLKKVVILTRWQEIASDIVPKTLLISNSGIIFTFRIRFTHHGFLFRHSKALSQTSITPIKILVWREPPLWRRLVRQGDPTATSKTLDLATPRWASHRPFNHSCVLYHSLLHRHLEGAFPGFTRASSDLL